MAVSEKVLRLTECYAALNDEERHEFVSMIAPIDEQKVSSEWMAEIRSRAEDIDSGRVQLVDGEAVLRRLRAI